MECTASGSIQSQIPNWSGRYSVFCLLAAPLILSNDLTHWTLAMAQTLLNKEMIAINQVRR
jgi:hypothetical protein